MPSSRRLPVYLAAAAASLCLSLWYFHLDPVVNNDGVLYLLAAQGDRETARMLGNWIFYSWLIQGASTLTGLGAEAAARLVNALLDLLLVIAFLRLLETLGAGRRALAIGAVAVLVLPYLNDNRAEIIRDHGYWAFSVLAMIPWVRLFHRFRWRDLAAWYLAMGTATLFRVEGAAFLLLLPLGLLFRPLPLRRRLADTARALLPLAALALPALLLLQQHDAGQYRLVMELGNAWRSLEQVFSDFLPKKADALADLLSPYYPRSAAFLVLLFAGVVDILKDLVTALSWPFALILLLRRWFPAPDLPAAYRGALAAYAAVSLAVLAFHEARTFIMVSRYTMALALMLLPVVVFSLDALWMRWRAGQVRPALAWATALAVAGLAADSLIESASHKGHYPAAGQWAAGQLAPQDRILTDGNPLLLRYYLGGGRPGGPMVEGYVEDSRPSPEGYRFVFVEREGGALALAMERTGAERVARISAPESRTFTVYRPGRRPASSPP